MGFTLIVLWLKGLQNGLSALAGGLSYFMPTFIYVWRVSSYAGARAATQFLIAFIAGETIKLVLSGLLFLLIIKYLHVSLLYALIGFTAAIVAFGIASFACLYQTGVKS